MKPLVLLTLLELTAMATPASATPPRLITDFTEGNDLHWYVLNDNVMGGRSVGDFAVAGGQLSFFGRTNTDGGGFSSLRTGPLVLDLSDRAGIQLRVKGDGRRYTWRLATDARREGRQVGYWLEFDTTAGHWLDVFLPFADFVPRFRGYRLDGPPLDPARIAGMGLMIYDKRDGVFDLRLSNVSAYVDGEPFDLADFRGSHRLLVLSAPRERSNAVLAMLREVAAQRPAFDERDLLLIVATDGGAWAARADRSVKGEDAARLRDALAMPADRFALRLVGKDGTVKLSADAAVPLEEVFALIDTMPMRQREMRSR
ncbi:MAG: CIA30 family protein [Pseudomonadota bacterium]